MLAGVKRPLALVGGGALALFVLFGLFHFQVPAAGGRFMLFGRSLAWTEGLVTRSLASLGTESASAASGEATPAAGSISCESKGSGGYQLCHYTDKLGQTMNFFLFVPAAFEPAQKYPLVLVLHGGGERARPGMTRAADDAVLEHAPYVKCWVGKPAHLNDPSVQSRWPSFIVVPQLDGLSRWVNVPPSQGSYKMAPEPTAELRMAKDIVDLLRQKYANVDPNRLYITGISLGGYGTWDAIERWPGYFAAAVAVSGGGDP
ncbi:MAG: alpha/beta hydrolase-fold protein, partial [Chloroflexi bacterium]|nr:alpha/beta hydrolase-fold protein [Chloroflexota bacterium]